MSSPRVLLDKGPHGAPATFQSPHRIIRADHPQDVPAALQEMQAARDSGAWLAGYASYELGYTFSHKLASLMPSDRACPLVLFGVFDAPAPETEITDTDATLTPPEAQWSLAQYTAAFDRLKTYIAAGDIYQANLTFPLLARYTGSHDALYARLKARQPVGYGALVDLGGPVLLSRSPELFFRVDADGTLTTKPMKGTAPRGKDRTEDVKIADWLHSSEKNRAENLMIVDLLRNDMSRISEIGSVKVPDLYTIESYATLHQMTSRITSRILPDTSIADILSALFPCGSVTGAPKIRAMQIIHELEAAPRDAYCGSIGWIGPDGAMEFNVAIRTLVCHDDGTARLDVGGGIVYDSEAEAEYKEALLKSRYALLD